MMNLDDAYRSLNDLHRVLAKRHTPPDRIDDICQSTFLRWWKTNQKQPGRLPTTYLVRLGLYECVSMARNLRPVRSIENEQSIPSEEDPFERMLAWERTTAVHDALSRLRPHLREVLALQFFEGLNLREIAAHCNESLNTVKLRLHRAKRHLRLRLESINAN
jgi:RNA polymerase sigma-70 factor (ECF subfamily)